MNFLENIVAAAEADVAKVEAEIGAVAPQVKADIAAAKAAIANPEVQGLIALFKSFTTHSTAPGAAVTVKSSVTAS